MYLLLFVRFVCLVNGGCVVMGSRIVKMARGRHESVYYGIDVDLYVPHFSTVFNIPLSPIPIDNLLHSCGTSFVRFETAHIHHANVNTEWVNMDEIDEIKKSSLAKFNSMHFLLISSFCAFERCFSPAFVRFNRLVALFKIIWFVIFLLLLLRFVGVFNFFFLSSNAWGRLGDFFAKLLDYQCIQPFSFFSSLVHREFDYLNGTWFDGFNMGIMGIKCG